MPKAPVVTLKHSEVVVPRVAEIGSVAPHCASELASHSSAAVAARPVVFAGVVTLVEGVGVDSAGVGVERGVPVGRGVSSADGVSDPDGDGCEGVGLADGSDVGGGVLVTLGELSASAVGTTNRLIASRQTNVSDSARTSAGMRVLYGILVPPKMCRPAAPPQNRRRPDSHA